MHDIVNRVTIGSLLHDIGKVLHRAPNLDGRAHSISGRDWVSQFIDDQSILDCIRYHHHKDIANAALASDSLAYVVYLADNISAGADRREIEGEAATGFAKNRPQESIYNLLNNANGQAAYKVAEIRAKINYPQEFTVYDPAAEYSKLIAGMTEGLRGLNLQAEQRAEYVNSLLELTEAYLSYVPSSTYLGEVSDISLFDHVKITAAFASAMVLYLADKNLTDYQSALFKNREKFYNEKAFCLFSCDVSGIQQFIYTISSKGALKGLRSRSFYLEVLLENLADEILAACSLYRSNLIYTGGGHAYILLPNTAEARTRAGDAVINLNRKLIELFDTRLFVSHGSQECSANELMSKTDDPEDYRNIFRSLAAQISERKLRRFSAEQLRQLNCNETDKAGRECRVCGVSSNLEERKEWSGAKDQSQDADQNPDQNANQNADQSVICRACAAFTDISRMLIKPDSVFVVAKQALNGSGAGVGGGAEAESVSGTVAGVGLDTEIEPRPEPRPKSEPRSEGETRNGPNLASLYGHRPAPGTFLKLFSSWGEEQFFYALTQDSAKKLLQKNPELVVRVYSKNRYRTGLSLATKLWLGDYAVTNPEGDLKTFDDLAKSSAGIDRIGVLRADVDNMGTAFVSGFIRGNPAEADAATDAATTTYVASACADKYRYLTLSRTAALSRSLSIFFKYYLNDLLANGEYSRLAPPGRRNIVVVYSGGDDLFMVGAWNEVLCAALDIRRAFARYTGNTLTMSAGFALFEPGYPITRMAAETAELEEAAKKHRYPDGDKYRENQNENENVNVKDKEHEHENENNKKQNENAKENNKDKAKEKAIDNTKKEKDSISLLGMEMANGRLQARHTYTWEIFENQVLGEKFAVLESIFANGSTFGNSFLYNILDLLRQADSESINLARLAYLLARREPGKGAAAELKRSYQDFVQHIYRWALRPEDRRQLITAIIIYAYYNRDDKDEKGVNRNE